MFIVGIDIAKRSHVAHIIDAEGKTVVKPFSFRSSCSGCNTLLVRMNKITNCKSEFILAMEAKLTISWPCTHGCAGRAIGWCCST